jgi:hypothetical protein
MINPANANSILVGPLHDGGNNAFGIRALALDADNQLCGATSDDSPISPDSLVKVDPFTALVTVIGPLNAPSGGGAVDLAFGKSGALNAALIGWFANSSAYGTIDLSNGQVTLLTGAGDAIGGVAVSPAVQIIGPNFYGPGTILAVTGTSQAPNAALRYFNPSNNASSWVKWLTGAPCCTFSALDYSSTGTLYGLADGFLVTIPSTYTDVTTIGAVPAGLAALSFAPAPPITVAVAPQTATLAGAQMQTFTATVTGTFNTSVTWSIPAGAPGSIDANTGIYTAPATIPASQTVTITATSQADSTKTGTASVTLSVPPTITSLSSASGPVGSSLTITGTNFGSSQGASTVTFNGVSAGVAVSWSDTSITVIVPSGATTGNVVVTVGGQSSTPAPFTVIVTPVIHSFWPTSGPVNTAVTITGSGFGPTQGSSTVTFGGVLATAVPYWSDTSITVLVPSGAISGSVAVTVNGVTGTSGSGNPFTVTNPPHVTSVSPQEAPPNTYVTITGTGFGSQQGIGQVWLGTTYGTVVSWSDTQVVATIALASRTGTAKVLQSGVWSNSLNFTVDTLTITRLSTNFGLPGDPVVISGSGFGDTKGTGTIQLGSLPAIVRDQDWTATQITATVAAGSVSGIARVTQNGIPSNALTFTVPVSSGAVTMAPNIINMVVGDSRNIQALDGSSRPVTGLNWTSSDPTIVNVSPDEPIMLTAAAPGHVTVTAGGASADVTVWPATTVLPEGTLLWSNPGNGSGVKKIVPAVPSPSGVADVFAIQNDGTIQAITADGITAWTATTGLSVQDLYAIPDFQGGLIAGDINGGMFRKFDGITGQPYPAFGCDRGNPAADTGCGWPVVHPDGTVFMVTFTPWPSPVFLTGFDPTTGSTKFNLPLPAPCTLNQDECPIPLYPDPVIAGDGYAYVPIVLSDSSGMRLIVVRTDTSGGSTQIPVKQWSLPWSGFNQVDTGIITNADQGIILTWRADWPMNPNDPFSDLAPGDIGMATINGTSVNLFSGPSIPGQEGSHYNPILPFLQTQDGTFVGTVFVGSDQTGLMVAFDASGNLRWSVPGWWLPQIATTDGGVIASEFDSLGALESNECDWCWDHPEEPIATVTFDQNGNQTGQVASLPVQSWTGNTYQYGSVIQELLTPIDFASSYAAGASGNLSPKGTYVKTYDTPQQAAYTLYNTNVTLQPKCDALMAQFASMAHVPKDILVAQLRATALGVRDYIFDGPSDDKTSTLDPVKFPGTLPPDGSYIGGPGQATVKEWFAYDLSRQGLSQYNGYAVWVGIDDWHSWVGGWFSPMLDNHTGKLNYYGLGTIMHETLHKNAVAGGFIHTQMDAAIRAVTGVFPYVPKLGYNNESQGIGLLCFGGAQ